MKILVLVNTDVSFSNPYVKTLMQGVCNQFEDVEWCSGLENFWNEKCFQFDIIHIHWPDAFVWSSGISFDEFNVSERFQLLKDKGVRVISTCHNVAPHYMNEETLTYKLYDVVYRMSHAIIHLGKYSLNLFQDKYPHVTHYLLAHHVYDTVYNSYPTRTEAVKKLRLNSDKLYILCLGAFRSDEERQMVAYLAARLKESDICFLAPSFMKIPKRRNFFCLIKPVLKYFYYKIRFPNIIFNGRWISDEMLVYYYGASSISLIHRLHILNSGNLPLGFLMRQVVVGPDMGNVGEILKTTGNPVFNPINNASLVGAIKEAQELANKQKGEKNFKYAMKNWNTALITKELYEIYKTEINK